MDVQNGLALEASLHELKDGEKTSILAEIVCYCPGAVACRSFIRGQIFLTDAPIDRQKGTISMLNVTKTLVNGKIFLTANDDCSIFQHGKMDLKGLSTIVEACAGIGAVGRGFAATGAKTICYVEQNEAFAKWLTDRFETPVVKGNIVHHQTVKAVNEVCEFPPVFSAGVSCQPLSGLGDKKEQYDQRSESFPGALAMGYHLRSMIVILECTPGAFQSAWAQSLLQQFQQQTGYIVHQRIVHLHNLWPSYRNRWWAVISHPLLNLQEFPDLPNLTWPPGILHLMPKMMKPSGEVLEQIELSLYELRHFHAQPKGITGSLINKCVPCPTATHSWGSQVIQCPCKCRMGGFTQARINERGLYGVLVDLDGMVRSGDDWFHRMRHLLPQEVALLNGLNPEWVTPGNLNPIRLDLAGTGQLASPLQSGWVFANILKTVGENFSGFPLVEPKNVLAVLVNQLFDARDCLIELENPTRYMHIFETAMHDLIGSRKPAPLVEELTQELRLCIAEKEQALAPQPDEASVREASEPADHRLSEVAIRKGKGGSVAPKNKSASSIQAYSDQGGLSAFSTATVQHENDAKRRKCDISADLPHPKLSAIAPIRSDDTFENEVQQITKSVDPVPIDRNDQHETDKIEVPEVSPTLPWTGHEDHHDGGDQNRPEDSDKRGTFWIAQHRNQLMPTAFTGNPTIGQVLQAEKNIQLNPEDFKAVDLMGNHLPLGSTINDEQALLVRDIPDTTITCKRSLGKWATPATPPSIEGLTRLVGLWHQSGWVAEDEMTYYLETVNLTKDKNMFVPPVILDEKKSAAFVWGTWICRLAEIAEASNTPFVACTACFHQNHWFPIKVEVQEGCIQFWTTPGEVNFITKISQEVFTDFTIKANYKHLTNKFPADCGFQTLAWLKEINEDAHSTVSMDTTEAMHWRSMFARYLIMNNRQHDIIDNIVLGGANMTKDLQTLLESHGVDSARSMQHAEHIIESIGSSRIANILQAPKPWADLKQAANAHKPAIQLVHSSELKAVIAAKIASGQAIGRKNNKKKGDTAPVPVRIRADQIRIPDGIFQQQDGTKLSQVGALQIGQNTKGIAVVNIQEAIPFFNIPDPIAQEGLALLILDHEDERIPVTCSSIRFPAQFLQTDEPIIVTAAILQLGKQCVTRHLPPHPTKVEEVSTNVVRILAYKDEYKGQNWDVFVTSPVKCIMKQEGFVDLDSSTIIDVWDRQFLNGNFQKCKPEESSIFIVTMRMTTEGANQIQLTNGVGGIFVEPRTDNGRNPHPNFKVIWLPKRSYGDALVAKQRTSVDTWLVRNGDRFGLRTTLDKASEVHSAHRPEVEFLEGELKTFLIGPLPFGTTKASLNKVFKQWSWKARPGQPMGQTKDFQGSLWSAQSAENPSHWIFTMEHGDVLISIQDTKPASVKPSASVVASKRTLQHLHQSPSIAKTEANDPWDKDDPWSRYTPTKAISTNQIAAIEAKVQKRVIESIQQQEDSSMDPAVEGRVCQLEQQVKQLSDSLGNFHLQQQQHNNKVATDIQNVKHQLDGQMGNIQAMISDKMEEQLSRMEALLSKRVRHE